MAIKNTCIGSRSACIAAGTYSYSLLIDANVIDTKRMIREGEKNNLPVEI